jgi:hypothetical protein
LRFKNNNISIKIPETAHKLSTSPSLRVLKDGDSCYLIREDSAFHLDLANSMGIGFIDSTFWDGHPKSQQEFLMLSLLWLLRKHGLYALHGNALVKEAGILLVGGTGSGKSTTALSLIRQGWRYLSDDVTLLRYNLDGIEAIAFPKGFSIDPDLANHYPELSIPFKASLNGQKRFLDINSICPDRFLFSCIPRVLIFPKIVPQDKSQIVPIYRTKALILLIDNSGGFIVGKKVVTKQIEVLKKLVYQTSHYQLLLGRDLYKEPEKIAEVLSEV